MEIIYVGIVGIVGIVDISWPWVALLIHHLSRLSCGWPVAAVGSIDVGFHTPATAAADAGTAVVGIGP